MKIGQEFNYMMGNDKSESTHRDKNLINLHFPGIILEKKHGPLSVA